MAFERVCALSDVPENGALRVELADLDGSAVQSLTGGWLSDPS